MKRTLLITILAAGITATGFAQQHPRQDRQERTIRQQRIERSPEERARQYTDALDKRLNLNDKQEKEIYRMRLKDAQKREKLHEQMVKRHQKDMRALQADREASEQKLNRILSTEQRATYEKLRVNRKERLENRRDRINKQLKKNRSEVDRQRQRG